MTSQELRYAVTGLSDTLGTIYYPLCCPFSYYFEHIDINIIKIPVVESTSDVVPALEDAYLRIKQLLGY